LNTETVWNVKNLNVEIDAVENDSP